MFKFYKNKKTRHPSISIRTKDKTKWSNMPISHSKTKGDANLIIDDPHPLAKKGDVVYIRLYIRKDKRGVKGHPYREYVLTRASEKALKRYLRRKYKKDDVKLDGLSPAIYSNII